MEYHRKIYIVLETLASDGVLVVAEADAIADWMIATSNSNLEALIGWES
jgi:hypothetical protein